LSLFISCEVFDTLVGFEVIFDKMDFSGSVNPFKSMRRISIHVSVTVWSSSVREKNGNLMESLWGMLPEIEDHIGVVEVSGWVSLLGMEEIWELNWIIDEENRGVISNHVVVTFFGVEFDGKSSWISDGISSSSFSSNSGESKEQWGSFSDSVEESSFGKMGDIFGYLKDTMSTRSFSVDNSFWNSFSIEAGKLIDEGEVLKENWSIWSCGH
jgi:hypothetical protein